MLVLILLNLYFRAIGIHIAMNHQMSIRKIAVAFFVILKLIRKKSK